MQTLNSVYKVKFQLHGFKFIFLQQNGQTPLDIASKLGYVTVMETLKDVSEPSMTAASHDKYKVVAPETMLETFMSDSEEEGGSKSVIITFILFSIQDQFTFYIAYV